MLVEPGPVESDSEWRRRLGEMHIPECISSNVVLNRCLDVLVQGGRVSEDDAMRLMRVNSLSALSSLADIIKHSRYGDDAVSYTHLTLPTILRV